MSNEHLDRAIEAGHAALNAKDGFPSDWREQGKDYETDRTYARALVAELLRGMEPEGEGCHGLVQFYHHQNGFNSALAEIRRRAGIVEGEG